MISVGKYWSDKLATDLLKISNTIRIEVRYGGTACPGSTDKRSGLYDPKLDRAYHAANPTAPVCVHGLIAQTINQPTVRGFHFVNLKAPEFREFPIGEVPDNSAMLLVGSNQNIANIYRWEYPTNLFWLVHPGFPRTVTLSDVPMFYIAVGREQH